MSKEKIRQGISFLLFVIALWALMVRQVMAMMPIIPDFVYYVTVYGDKIIWCSMGMLGMVIICNRPSIWDIFACIWAIVTVYISGNYIMLILLFLVVAVRKMNVDKSYIIMAWMIPVSAVIIVTMILYPILHAQGHPYAVDYCGVRWNYFFGHPNGFGTWFSLWTLGIIYLTEKKMPRWMASLVLLGAAVFLAIVPESKTAAIVLILGSVLLLMEKYAWKLCKIAMYIIPIACILATVVLTAIYYKGILTCDQYILHPTLSMRFQDAAINLTKCPLNLWGQKVYHLGETIEFYGAIRHDVSMDNGIVTALIYYGVLLGSLFIITLIINIYMQAKAEDTRHRMQAILLTVIFVMGMMEWPAWYGTIGFPMFFLGDWMKNDKKKSKTT